MTQQINPVAGGYYIRGEDGNLRPDPAYEVQAATEEAKAPATTVAKPTTTVKE